MNRFIRVIQLNGLEKFVFNVNVNFIIIIIRRRGIFNDNYISRRIMIIYKWINRKRANTEGIW